MDKKIKYVGFNTIFLWATNLDINSTEQKDEVVQTRLDTFGMLLEEAANNNIDVHLWYSPWSCKDEEITKHPEWAEVDNNGIALKSCVCASRIEVRDYVIDKIIQFIKHYPKLKGVHLEEPGFNWINYCFCDNCRKIGKELFGFDIKEKPDYHGISHMKILFCTNFIYCLREKLKEINPNLLLSANGSEWYCPDWHTGRDWTIWARLGYLDFYVPQVYHSDTDSFINALQGTMHLIGIYCKVCPGIAISYSGIHPKKNTREELINQIEAARKMGAGGIVVFGSSHITDKEIEAFSCVLPYPEETKK